ncbi:MAG: BrnA antitoxin family protein [Rhodospirillales bacterium]|nr:BrnA antitoxin family protein [Rhodospirillales bacterium]
MGRKLNTAVYGVPDEENPEITPKEFAQAKPFTEVFPALAEKMRRARGKQVAPTKELVSLRLSRETLAKFRAQGPGWQTRIDEVLFAAAKKL